MLLGTLGYKTWFRCEDCGIDYSIDKIKDFKAYSCPVCGLTNSLPFEL